MCSFKTKHNLKKSANGFVLFTLMFFLLLLMSLLIILLDELHLSAKLLGYKSVRESLFQAAQSALEHQAALLVQTPEKYLKRALTSDEIVHPDKHGLQSHTVIKRIGNYTVQIQVEEIRVDSCSRIKGSSSKGAAWFEIQVKTMTTDENLQIFLQGIYAIPINLTPICHGALNNIDGGLKSWIQIT